MLDRSATCMPSTVSPVVYSISRLCPLDKMPICEETEKPDLGFVIHDLCQIGPHVKVSILYEYVCFSYMQVSYNGSMDKLYAITPMYAGCP